MPKDYRPAGRKRGYRSTQLRILTRRRASILAGMLIAALLVALVVSLRGILFPFVVAGIIAYILEPFVRRIAHYGVPRWVSVIVTYVLFFTSLYGFSYYLVPKLEYEGARLLEKLQYALREAPQMYESIERRIEGLVEMARPATVANGAAKAAERSDAKDARWGFGPNLYIAPGGAVMDVPALEELDLGSSGRDLVLTEEARLGSEELGPRGRSSEKTAEAKRKSNILVEQIDDRLFGIRFRESSFEVEQVGDGKINVTPRAELAAENKLKNLQAELVQAVKRAVEQLGHGVLGSFLGLVRSVLQGIVGAIIGIILTFMVAAFILIDMDHLRSFFYNKVPPRYRADYQELIDRLDRGLSGVVRGQLFICLINGTLSGIGFAIFIPEYAIVLAILSGVLSLIPIFGTIISSVPAVLIGLTHSWGTALAVLAWILGIHFTEANILNPKIIGTSAKINPVIVIFVLIAGEHAYGLAGALLAVPVTSVIQSFVSFTYKRIRPYIWGERA